MKIKITYEYDPRLEVYNFWASTTYNHMVVRNCGRSFEEAKVNLVENIAKIIKLERNKPLSIPPPEEVEIP